MIDIIFYILAFFMVSCAIAVVSAKNILHAAIALIAAFLGTAILYLVQSAEFVALAQIMIYIGGVVIFAVFTILLTTRLGENFFKIHKIRHFIAFIISGGLLAIFARVFMKSSKFLSHETTNHSIADIEEIGFRLLNFKEAGFLVPFELISILLLVTMIGAVVIARKDRELTEEEEEIHGKISKENLNDIQGGK